MLSNKKLLSLLFLSTIATAAATTTTTATIDPRDPSKAETPYKVQEDEFFNLNKPSHVHDFYNGRNPDVFFFLDNPDDFVQHKSTLFSRLEATKPGHLTYLKEAFEEPKHEHTAKYAAHITVEDAKAISSKNQTMPKICQSLANVLMASPLQSLRALSTDCHAAVVNEATKVYGSGSSTIIQRKLVNTFVLNSYKLEKKFWENNFDRLTNLTRQHPHKNDFSAKVLEAEQTNYSKYGAHFELFVKDDDRCRTLPVDALNTISTAQAAKISPSCFTSMKGYDKFIPATAKKVSQLPKNIFSEVDKKLTPKVYEYMTNEQVAEFGSKVTDSHCGALDINQLFKSRMAHINATCWNSYLVGFDSTENTTPVLGQKIKLIRPECWEGVQTEGFSRIHQDDLQHISSPIMNKFLTANPDFCESLEKLETAESFASSSPSASFV